MLEQYIVNQGESDQQAKLLARRLEYEEEEKKRKEKHIRELKEQLDNQ